MVAVVLLLLSILVGELLAYGMQHEAPWWFQATGLLTYCCSVVAGFMEALG